MKDKVFEFIKSKNLILKGEIIGVAVSGGIDSMSLLYYLNSIKDKFGFKIVAITVDHMIRGNESYNDCEFVKKWCKDRNIDCQKFSFDSKKFANENNIGLEESAREGRYSIFEQLLEKKIVDKIALAHHMSDQVETVLLHIFRGSGLNGAIGMSENRDNRYIRPFLQTSKAEIIEFAKKNALNFVDDKTNSNSTYSRNFLRNEIIPLLKQKWQNFDQNIINFASNCKEDNEYIFSQINTNKIIFEKEQVKIPLDYFSLDTSLINRTIFLSLKKINITKDIEKKHIEKIKSLSKCENGKKINLPNKLIAQKEYEYICLYLSKEQKSSCNYPFKVGTTNFCRLYSISVKKTKKLLPQKDALLVDCALIPKNAVFRARQKKDKFTKFGSGTKALKDYFIDKKIPNKDRDFVPLLAVNSEILCVLNNEISEKVKITPNTKFAYIIKCKKI